MKNELAEAIRITMTELDEKEEGIDDGIFLVIAEKILEKLGTKKLELVKTEDNRAQDDLIHACAAKRTLDTLTRWATHGPSRTWFTRINASGRFELVMSTDTGARTFRGETVQDAYSQAAQALQFESEE